MQLKHLWILLLLSAGAFAQNTTVTGTIVDPNGNAYANGTASAQSVAPTGQASIFYGPSSTNVAGSFSIVIATNQSYIFTVCATPTQLGPLANPTPKQVCTNSPPIFVTGVSQDVSSQINAVAAVLGPKGSLGSMVWPLGGTGIPYYSGTQSWNSSFTTSNPIPINLGGTGTGTPSLVGGTNITVSGPWPNQTIGAAAAVTNNNPPLVANQIVEGNGGGDIITSPNIVDDGTGDLTATSFITPGDGVHPAYITMLGNTTAPALTPNTVGFLGPTVTSMTAYAFQFSSTAPTNGQCLVAGTPAGGIIPIAGGSCGGGGGSFSGLTGGTNTSAAMLVGTGASLGPTGSGTITATALPASGLTTGTMPAATVTENMLWPVILFSSAAQGANGQSINCSFPLANAPGTVFIAGSSTLPQFASATFPSGSLGTQYLECRYLLPSDFKANTISSITAIMHVDTDTTNTHIIEPDVKLGCDGADGSTIQPTYGSAQTFTSTTITSTINQKLTTKITSPTVTCSGEQDLFIRFEMNAATTVNTGNIVLDALKMELIRAVVSK